MELDTLEAFALAEDRTKILEQLIPGTEDYYYARCLEHQHRGEFDQVPELVKTWIARHHHTSRVNEILNRQALLTWDEGGHLYDRLSQDAEVQKLLKPEELTECFDLDRQLRHVNRIFERVLDQPDSTSEERR